MPLVRWVFTDPTDSSTYTFDMNPSAGGTPNYQKNVQYINTAGPNGNVLAFEGRDQPRQLQVSGTLKEEAHLNAMVTWFEKRHQVQITDDLNRTFTIYITGFNAQRVRSRMFPWKHTYTMNYVILDWT